jgi:DNA-3-methyladenine glycosylase
MVPPKVITKSRYQKTRLCAVPMAPTAGSLQKVVAELRPLPSAFFDRDPRTVGKELLGKLLVRRYGQEILMGRIVETEAYLGKNDPAAHSATGRTARNAVIFGPPGHAYVYFIYGKHFCLNVSCLADGEAGCVLFRALEPVAGLETMAEARGFTHKLLEANTLRLLTNGPSRLTQAMRITRSDHNGMDLSDATQSLWLAEDGFEPDRVRSTPRVGISKAIDRKLRYLVDGNPFVSR